MSDAASTRAWVRWTSAGFHYWPGALGNQTYLSVRHRHLFHFEVAVDVYHDDRDVEFHDLLNHCKQFTGYHAEWEGNSCESIARLVAAHVQERWPDRNPTVTVSEDGECGATVQF